MEQEFPPERTVVFHGSRVPVEDFDPVRQQSGYYPGFYTTISKESASGHGAHLVAFEVRPNRFFSMDDKDSETLKKLARAVEIDARPASGAGEVEFLKRIGLAGIRRGSEYILFDPHAHRQVDPETLKPVEEKAPSLPLPGSESPSQGREKGRSR